MNKRNLSPSTTRDKKGMNYIPKKKKKTQTFKQKCTLTARECWVQNVSTQKCLCLSTSDTCPVPVSFSVPMNTCKCPFLDKCQIVGHTHIYIH